MTIHDAPNKRARTLVEIDATDEYHVNIQKAAAVLIKAGYYDAKYMTQWARGTTLWDSGVGYGDLMVSTQGKIER